ncbi:MAG TPA: Fe-S protein assembly co-chaperone HscB [Casimicrobiaceae bacterium]|nr:Fe-S protein assembly co-chaperone HscB [Casimicrobiaceae bacterium]
MIGGLAIGGLLFPASPMIDFSRNHFELFGLPTRFAVDRGALEHAYRDVQRNVHPDRYAGADDAQKRLALQASARANEAYRALRDPLTRAEYLLSLRGIDAGGETGARLSVVFLTRQLERREAAEEATRTHDAGALAALVDEVRRDAGALAADVAPLLDAGDPAAAPSVREWRFLVKLADDLDALRAAADEA